ncbi:phage minor capsid protein [Alkalihalobacillus trypoxylicola]|uniref:Capsid protein n=1 Tax=Alkalihalobacillus trypoxylicola TaxID=519424 RepID=A0A162D5E5_9BACI|nr:phage minor capsid protein [Alkalihalobacillus trypoxylicola]KYG28172.1 hypothetical protein AZF04_09725 [Alkalihalobacillus trypoxylicola]
MASPKITPNEIFKRSQSVKHIYASLEDEIFQLIARTLRTPQNYDDVLQWQVEKMNDLHMINRRTVTELSKATGLAEKEIEKAIRDVAYGSIEDIDNQLKSHYQTLPVPSHVDQIIDTFANRAMRDYQNFVNQSLITTSYGVGTATQTYQRIIEQSTAKVLGGTMTINKAVTQTVIEWGEKGLDSGFKDKGGRIWNVQTYAESVIRTSVNNTYNDLRTSRMRDYDIDLVLVNSYPDAREACSQIQGNVCSMSNPSSNPNYPSIYEFGYGTPGGIRGVNCRHILYPFIEGVNINNQPQYNEHQAQEKAEIVKKQRYYEREIRKNKRSLSLAETMGDEDEILKYKHRVRTRQAQIREFISENNLPRRYDRERAS